MNQVNKKYIFATIEQGQGYNQVIGGVDEEITLNYDFTSNTKEAGSKDSDISIFDYHIKKIIYTLNANQYIQTLKLIYKNRNDGQLKTLLDTTGSHIKEEKTYEIEFEDFEEIIEVLFYLTKKDPRLGAISIKTNLNKVKNIGSETNLDLVKDEDVLINKNNIIYGFGVHAGKAFGVSGIYCYFIDKTLYGIILYDGLLQLRSKLKKNPEFRNKMLEKRESLNEKQKLILDSCDLPDTAFFPLASYIMSQ